MATGGVARGGLIGVVFGGLFAAGGCAEDALPALPSAVLVVDTDLPVPRALNRLRIDVFAEDGTWLHTRDVPRARPEDWPASFGLVAPDDTKATTVLVRLRGYAEGAVRDYVGSSPVVDPPVFEPPVAKQNLADLCTNVPRLEPLTDRTLRRGSTKITEASCNSIPTLDGSVAAEVVVAAKGNYRFEVVKIEPSEADTTLVLRPSCTDEFQRLACNDDISDDISRSGFTVELEPGTYTLVTGGLSTTAADITLRWGAAEAWTPSPVPPERRVTRAREGEPGPRLRRGAIDDTPRSEPDPPATVDRLVRIRLAPGAAGTGQAAVTLRGGCAGREAKLPAKGANGVTVEEARSCVDDFATVLPPEIQTPAAAPPRGGAAAPGSLVGTILNEPCAPADSDDQLVCVPGGAFLLGDPFDETLELRALSIVAAPARIAALHRFSIDRREFTVGRYREALAAGFQSTLHRPYERTENERATYTIERGNHEREPLNYVSWQYARALCRFYGGDLPTEAQWEYAATAAGRTVKLLHPKGDLPLTCDDAVLARDRKNPTEAACGGEEAPMAVGSAPVLADRTVSGIEGLVGNVQELTRDAAARYDAACWSGRGPIDPWCDDPSAPRRVRRGGSFSTVLWSASLTQRAPISNGIATPEGGFRCVYPGRPTRRWSVP